MMSGQMVVREIDAPQEHVGARILVIGDFFDARRHPHREARGQGTGDDWEDGRSWATTNR